MSVVAGLRDAVGAAHVLTEPSTTAGYTTDWTGRFSGSAIAVCHPGSSDEVRAVLEVASLRGVPVVAQGGNTGLVGGSTPGDAPAVVLSTRRLTTIEPVDVVGREVTVGAGVTIANLAAASRDAGLRYGVDFASRESATVGGSVATDAGGVRVCAFGTTRAQVLGVQAVLADGSIIDRLHGPVKDAGGFDLSQLLVGSEGTLAVITAARLRLVPPLPVDRMTALVPVSGIGDAVGLLRPGLLAAEYVESPVMKLTGGPTTAAAWVLVEGEDLDLPGDAIVAQDANDRARLWSWREGATEAVARVGIPLKLDVALPLGSIAEFRSALGSVTDAWSLLVWGHLAEGNLHLNVIGPSPGDTMDQVTDGILQLVARHHGSISSEHGIGRAKRRWLPLTRSQDELALMRAIKSAFDPTGILNPGVLF